MPTNTKERNVYVDNLAFAVYVFHAPIIIRLAMLMKPWEANPLLKWLVLCAISLHLSSAFSHFIGRRIPLLKVVL